MRFPLSIVLVVAAVSQVGATDCGQITRDQGFDLWCGETLCSWKLERGMIEKVGTWHEGDSGVSMVGDDVAFAQLTPVNNYDTTCIRFELISNIEETAEVRLNVDVFGDGTIEYSERIPSSNWKPVSFLIPIKPPYNGVRFEITKRGAGKAVVAQLQAETANNGECSGLTPIAPTPGPNGATCETDATCASGMCRLVNTPAGFGIARQCVGCDPALGASACTAGQACGYGAPLSNTLYVPVVCVPAGSHVLGEQCRTHAECSTGVCNSFVCSTCSSSTPCAGGEECGETYTHGPYVCSPNGNNRAATEPCASDGDCISGQCAGPERKQCDDGRACSTPAQCPVEDELAPGECLVTGIQGGRCE
jgi:hypothetical protein